MDSVIDKAFPVFVFTAENKFSWYSPLVMLEYDILLSVRCLQVLHSLQIIYSWMDYLLRSGFSIANQIKFDLRFTDLRLT